MLCMDDTVIDYETDLNYLTGDEKAALCHLTDIGNGERLNLHFGHLLRYCWDTGKWLFFDGHRWSEETGNEQAKRFAKETALSIYDEAKIKPDEHQRTATAKWAIASERRHQSA